MKKWTCIKCGQEFRVKGIHTNDGKVCRACYASTVEASPFVRPFPPSHRPHGNTTTHLTHEQIEQIYRGLERGEKPMAIARSVGCSLACVRFRLHGRVQDYQFFDLVETR